MKQPLAILLLLSACSPGDVVRGGAPEGGMPPGDGSMMQPMPMADGSSPMPMPGDSAMPPIPETDASEPNQDGFVPVFVAVGYQSHRVISCDQGLTWKHEEMAAGGGGDDGTLMRGLAYGKHKFVASVGGGGTRKLWTSDDGVTWKEKDLGGNGYSDVTFGQGKFVAGGGHISIVSTDGLTWGQEGTMGDQSGDTLRNLAYLDYQGGRFAAAGGGRRVNSRDGVVWGSEAKGGESLEALAGGGGVFVAVASSGTTQYSTDGGDTWQQGSIGGGGVRGIVHDGARFIVTTNSGSYFSTNGKDWESKGGGPGPYDFAVNDDRTHYAGVDADLLLHSTDGINWTKVDDGGPGYERVKFGWVKPSVDCPLP